MTKPKPKAIGYARVSTPNQLKGTGLWRQSEGIKKYAKENGYRLLHINEEQASRSVDWTERAELKKTVVECVEAGAVIICEAHDRLADFQRTIPVKVHFTSQIEQEWIGGIHDLIKQYNEDVKIERMEKCGSCCPLGPNVELCDYHAGFEAGVASIA